METALLHVQGHIFIHTHCASLSLSSLSLHISVSVTLSPPPPSLSLSDRHGCLFVLVQARLANRDWSKEVGSSDVAQEDFVVQHDMENCYMWVFKDRPQFALGSYMNGHSR